jgi:CRISPR/Cas system-associated endonuclease Cas1
MPLLGIMHADVRYRGSLATDLMEPARPLADTLLLDWLEAHQLQRGDVIEHREGICRIGPRLSRTFADFAPHLPAAVAPHAKQLARTLLKTADAATPLTRTRHRRAMGVAV